MSLKKKLMADGQPPSSHHPERSGVFPPINQLWNDGNGWGDLGRGNNPPPPSRKERGSFGGQGNTFPTIPLGSERTRMDGVGIRDGEQPTIPHWRSLRSLCPVSCVLCLVSCVLCPVCSVQDRYLEKADLDRRKSASGRGRRCGTRRARRPAQGGPWGTRRGAIANSQSDMGFGGFGLKRRFGLSSRLGFRFRFGLD